MNHSLLIGGPIKLYATISIFLFQKMALVQLIVELEAVLAFVQSFLASFSILILSLARFGLFLPLHRHHQTVSNFRFLPVGQVVPVRLKDVMPDNFRNVNHESPLGDLAYAILIAQIKL